MKIQFRGVFSQVNLLKIFIVILIFFGTSRIISFCALSAFHRVDIAVKTNNEEDLGQIYYTGSERNLVFSEKFTAISKQVQDGELSLFQFNLRNGIIKNLRVDPGESPGVYTIERLRMLSFFGQSLLLTPESANVTVKVDSQSTLLESAHGWSFTANGNDPYIIFSGDFEVSNTYLKYVFPLIFSLVVFFLLPEFKFPRNLSFLQDVKSKSSSSGDNIYALDGLRGFAALLVLADHSEVPGTSGLGPIGVIIFFCLSGFLLTMPFAKKPQVVKDRTYLRRYFIRRIKRIVPMFYFIITIEYLLQGQLGNFIRTAIFIQGLGILWTVLQEIYFYILLPFIIGVCYFLLKGRLLWCAFFLLILAFLFNNGYIPTIHVYQYESNMPLFIGVFMSGMAMCYFYMDKRIRQVNLLSKVADSKMLGIALLLGLFLTHNLKRLYLGVDSLHLSWVYTGNYCFIIAFILFVVVFSKRSLLARFFSLYSLRAVGIVGYSFYLLHPYVLHNILIPLGKYFGINLQTHTFILFLCALIVTYGLSAITYTFIERPFLTVSRRKNVTDAQYSRQHSANYVKQ